MKQAQLPSPLSHRTCAPGTRPWWQPSARPVRFLQIPLEAGVPKKGCCTSGGDPLVPLREGDVHGTNSFSHSLILWANAWCGHHRASTHVPTAGCQKGLNSCYKLGEVGQFQLQLKFQCQRTREPFPQDLHIISHASSANQRSTQLAFSCSSSLCFRLRLTKT